MITALAQRQEPITHVAIRFRGHVYALPAPNRHHHVMWQIAERQPDVECVDAHGRDQGFLDESGAYLTREAAYVRAKATGQLRRAPGGYDGPELFSEDLW